MISVIGRNLLLLTIITATALPGAAQSIEVGLEVVAEGLTAPLVAIEPPDASGRLFIVDQIGEIRIVGADGSLLDQPFLDISGEMVNLNPNFEERGLLGLAFHPDYATNGRFFVYYSAPLRGGAPAGWNHTSHISEFTASATNADMADADSERILLQVDQPQSNHNAGAIAFGPDGFLYIALGDGGGAHDTADGHVGDWYADNAGGNGQDVTENLLGSILRIDVDQGDPYAIPPDNPFFEGPGLDEIYAYGLRNPYRFSFDMGGDHMLLAGDAGQSRWEEVSRIERGGNYGWNVYEGAHCFDADSPDSNPMNCPEVVGAGHPDEGAGMIDPVIEYVNGTVGVAVVGGYVYRGSNVPALDGMYLFGDWLASGRDAGIIFAASPQEEGMWPFEEVVVADGGFNQRLLAFGQDQEGEVYVLGTDVGGPNGNTGTVYRIVPAGGVAAERPEETPAAFTLLQNYPNPFNPSTQIRFDLASPADVTLQVFDALGRAVATLAQGPFPAGTHSLEWNGTNAAGRAVPSGIYVYRLRTDQGESARTMTLIR